MTHAPSREFITGRIVSGGVVIEDGALAFEDGRIIYAGAASGLRAAAGHDDGGWTRGPEVPGDSMILPGLVDLHCHGGNGGDFSSGEDQQARSAIDFLHRSGTTTLLASMVTASRPDLLKGIHALRRLVDEELVAGIHLEGPFLSHARCGAQNPEWLLEPDLQLATELIDAAAGTLKSMTYAPELPGANDLVNTLAAAGVLPSLGHTDSDAETAAASLAAALTALDSASIAASGASPARPASVAAGNSTASGSSPRPTVTHLFNGMPPMHHRSPGPVPACLRVAKAGNAVVEMIADNVHLAPQTVVSVFELVGARNIALITDSMAAAGLSDGTYTLGPSAVTVRDGVATVDSTGSIAGGMATMLQVLQHCVDAGVPLTDAVAAATEVPATAMGLGHDAGRLSEGYRADAIIVSRDWELLNVLRNGEWLEPLALANGFTLR
ncbi:N-acetylglucosamine-6-phosphate deacetylase [Arthrobacter sp. H14]|uniref:N-acetylglucosamine-6-phosphate deacetylase n=1 Tax=Arthrobacter sp. H14 TaxID=1312959 RepID=UPI0004B9C3EE|nr:amidohydrolase family protein [Arthrobacter sp. H14]